MGLKKIFSKEVTKKVFSKKLKKEELSEMPFIICQNCDTEFQGHYCPRCGQPIKEFDKPFNVLIYDFMGTLFAFDTRFFRTMKAVLFSPGKFSTEYMEGKRARYMKPFQFYVFVSFLFFLLLSVQTNRLIDPDQFSNSVSEQDSLYNDTLINAQENGWLQFGTDADSLTSDSLVVQKEKKSKVITANDLNKAKAILQENLEDEDNSESEHRILRNAKQMLSYPDVFMSKLYKYLSWSFFLVMPIFGFWLWLFFRKKRRFYAGHFIYSLVAHATVFLIFTFIISIKLIFPDKSITPENYLYWLIPIYVWIGMKRFYGRSITRTTANFILLGFIYTFSMVVTVAVVFIISLYF